VYFRTGKSLSGRGGCCRNRDAGPAFTYGGFAEASYMLAGDNDELREQLRPMIHDAFEYERGGTATFEKTKQIFKDKYYQQCMERPAP
jgi:hypothetical protein